MIPHLFAALAVVLVTGGASFLAANHAAGSLRLLTSDAPSQSLRYDIRAIVGTSALFCACVTHNDGPIVVAASLWASVAATEAVRYTVRRYAEFGLPAKAPTDWAWLLFGPKQRRWLAANPTTRTARITTWFLRRLP